MYLECLLNVIETLCISSKCYQLLDKICRKKIARMLFLECVYLSNSDNVKSYLADHLINISIYHAYTWLTDTYMYINYSKTTPPPISPDSTAG